MHVPFSMSDEPDLGDEFKAFDDVVFHTSPPDFLLEEKVYTQRDFHLLIQKHQKTVDELRLEILAANDNLREAYDRLANLKHDIRMLLR